MENWIGKGRERSLTQRTLTPQRGEGGHCEDESHQCGHNKQQEGAVVFPQSYSVIRTSYFWAGSSEVDFPLVSTFSEVDYRMLEENLFVGVGRTRA